MDKGKTSKLHFEGKGSFHIPYIREITSWDENLRGRRDREPELERNIWIVLISIHLQAPYNILYCQKKLSSSNLPEFEIQPEKPGPWHCEELLVQGNPDGL